MPGPAEHDELGALDQGVYGLADRNGGPYVVVRVEQKRWYVDLGQHMSLVLKARLSHRSETAWTELPDTVDEARHDRILNRGREH